MQESTDAWAARAELGRKLTEQFHEAHAKIRSALDAERARVAHARDATHRAAVATRTAAKGGITLDGVRASDTVRNSRDRFQHA